VLAKAQMFDAFNGDNDPYGEHDFVAFEHGGDEYLAAGDFADPTRVRRALSKIKLAVMVSTR
jgi:hypothetical protein